MTTDLDALLRYIVSVRQRTGVSPTLRQVCAALGSVAQYAMRALEARGELRRAGRPVAERRVYD